MAAYFSLLFLLFDVCVFPGANRTFGVSIDELLKRSEGCEIPPIITSIVEYLKEHGNVVNVC